MKIIIIVQRMGYDYDVYREISREISRETINNPDGHIEHDIYLEKFGFGVGFNPIKEAKLRERYGTDNVEIRFI